MGTLCSLEDNGEDRDGLKGTKVTGEGTASSGKDRGDQPAQGKWFWALVDPQGCCKY